MEQHTQKINKLAEQISDAFREKKQLYIFHGDSHTTRDISEEKKFIDISNLDQILEINFKERYAIVEPNVTMEKLVLESFKKGLIPLIVTEFPQITIGGAISGGAGESSSFKYGGVHSICDEYEVVLGNGQITQVSLLKNSDLFCGLSCSYGSLGIVTKIKIRLIEAKNFVQLNYFSINSFSELTEIISLKAKEQIDFLDAIMFSKDEGVVMVGKMVCNLPDSIKARTFSKSLDDWFFIRAREKMRDAIEPDYIPTIDYLFRYNIGAFWVGKFLFDWLMIPVNKFTKRLLFRFLDAKTFYKGLHSANMSQRCLVQDFCLPSNQAVNFLNYLEQNINKYPLWICPLQASKIEDKFSPTYLKTDFILNIGLYADFRKSYEYFIEVNKKLEDKLTDLGGKKVLYAHQYYSLEKFWGIYDINWYKQLRTIYYAEEVFPGIYEKTHVNKRYKTKVFIIFIKFIIALFKKNT